MSVHRRPLLLAPAVVSLSLFVTACGGSPASHAARENGAVAFAACMRSNRVPNWPDPNSSGVFDKSKLTLQQLGVSSSRLQAAQSACNHLLPNGSSGPSAARLQQERAQGLAFARCVRSHRLPNFPDPGSDGRIPDPASVGIDQGSPKFKAANVACAKNRPPYIPSNAAYGAYARSHG